MVPIPSGIAGAGVIIAMIGLTAAGVTVPAAARPAFNDPAAVQKLMDNLSGGYTPSDCQPAATHLARPVAFVGCGANHAPGGPQSALYFLYANTADLTTDLKYDVAGSTVLPFPDGTRGPIPWRRNATPEQPAGSIVIIMFSTGIVGLVWSNDAELMKLAAQLPANGDLAALLNWWQAEGAR